MTESSGSSPRPASSHSTNSQYSSNSVARSTFEDLEELTEESCYISEELPRKGRGLMASRPVKRGELLFAESPVFAFPTSPLPTNSEIMIALSNCSREQQQQYFALSNSFRGEAGVLPAQGVFRSCQLPFRQPAKGGNDENEEAEEECCIRDA